jgi:oligopeptide transport system substrate-binding protein
MGIHDSGWIPGPPLPPPHPGPQRRGGWLVGGMTGVFVLLLIVAVVIASQPSGRPSATNRPGATRQTPRPGSSGSLPSPASGGQVVVAGSEPSSWDPAQIGDAGSAGLITQIAEGLTALDADNRVQPALAASWSTDQGGKRTTFTLRSGITFSDGTPITSGDVRRSWLRVLDPANPSPLASLLGDVEGANAYLAGTGTAEAVGIDASGDTLVVRFRRPASYFIAAAASPTLAVVPPNLPDGFGGTDLPPNLVVSGAYIPESMSGTEIRLIANQRYWAGPPTIGTVVVKTSFEGASPVDVFQSGGVDYTSIFRDDASWIRYHRELGPQLRRATSLSVSYYGFDTTRPPFDSPDVRRAFGMAVDWDRLVKLEDAQAVPATSLVPEGIAGRGTEDFSPPYDPTAARQALATAGYPEGRDFPVITLASSGGYSEEAVASELKQVLGIQVSVELMAFRDLSARLNTDQPQLWTLSWIADYPHPQDFLGLLLETGSGSNTGKWSNPDFDAAVDRAAATDDPTAQETAYTEAQRIVRDQVPLIPLRYGDDWSLSRTGLLGAKENGVGFLRFASLAWAK